MIIRDTPISRSRPKAARAAGRGVSIRPIAPRSRPPLRTIMVVRPASRSRPTASVAAGPRAGTPWQPNISALPIQTASPSTLAVTPRPVRLLSSVATGIAARSIRSLPPLTMARAKG